MSELSYACCIRRAWACNNNPKSPASIALHSDSILTAAQLKLIALGTEKTSSVNSSYIMYCIPIRTAHTESVHDLITCELMLINNVLQLIEENLRDLHSELKQKLHAKYKLGMSNQGSWYYQSWKALQPHRDRKHSDTSAT